MSQNVKTTEGSVPLSKSQLKKKARKGPPISHGGICNKCGQSSSSCTTGTVHASCLGFATRRYLDPIYHEKTGLGDRLQGGYLTADDSPYDATDKGRGFWLSLERFAEEKELREKHSHLMEEARVEKLRGEKHVIMKDGVFYRFENGLGEPIELASKLVFTDPTELSEAEEKALLSIQAAKVPVEVAKVEEKPIEKKGKPVGRKKEKAPKKVLPEVDPTLMAAVLANIPAPITDVTP